MKPFKSNAEWPKGTIYAHNSYVDEITTDSHDTYRQAECVCEILRKEGFGGYGNR